MNHRQVKYVYKQLQSKMQEQMFAERKLTICKAKITNILSRDKSTRVPSRVHPRKKVFLRKSYLKLACLKQLQIVLQQNLAKIAITINALEKALRDSGINPQWYHISDSESDSDSSSSDSDSDNDCESDSDSSSSDSDSDD